MKHIRLFLLGILLLTAGTALAAPDGAFDFYASNLTLLESKQVQKDVGVTENQRAKMNVFANEDRPKRTAIMQQMQKDAEAARKAGKQYRPDFSRIKPLDAALKQSVLGVLSAAQLRRLREITLQAGGLVALMDARVAQEAGVPMATVKKLRDLFQSASRQADGIRQAAQKKVYDEFIKRKPKNQADADRLKKEAFGKYTKAIEGPIGRLQAQTQAKMLALVTAPQQAKFKQLEGKPFKQ